MIRLGILGAGAIAKTMAGTVRMMNDNGYDRIQLYGIASRSYAKAEAFAKGNGVIKAYGLYEEMVNDPDIDLVYVATPHSHHYEHAMLCLEHGIPVLVEKAFTANTEQAVKLLAYAEEHHLLATEAIWTRYQPMRQMINDAVFSGIIGTPKIVIADLSKPIAHKERIQKPELAGGVLLDMGIYPINFAEMIFGHPTSVVSVSTNNEYGMDLNDAYLFTFENGVIGSLYSSAEAFSASDGIIHGTLGYIVVRNVNNPSGMEIYNLDNELIRSIDAPEQLTGYEYEVMETVEALENGWLECPSMPHAETIHVMELMDGIRKQLGVVYPFEKN